MYILLQVFCGKIPKDVFEDEIIPLFEKCGQIWDLRLMMDPMTGFNRGYSFITFVDREGANEAVKQVCWPLMSWSISARSATIMLEDDPFTIRLKCDLADGSSFRAF